MESQSQAQHSPGGMRGKGGDSGICLVRAQWIDSPAAIIYGQFIS